MKYEKEYTVSEIKNMNATEKVLLFKNHCSDLNKMYKSEYDINNTQEIEDKLKKYRIYLNNFINLYSAEDLSRNDVISLNRINIEINKLQYNYINKLQLELQNEQNKSLQEKAENTLDNSKELLKKAQESYIQSRNTFIISLVASIVISISVSCYFSKQNSKDIEEQNRKLGTIQNNLQNIQDSVKILDKETTKQLDSLIIFQQRILDAIKK